jgi:hypothetical protein
MRRLFTARTAIVVAASAALTLGTTASLSAQVFPPLPAPRPPALERPTPVGLAYHFTRATGRDAAELLPIAGLRVLLRERGFGPDVTAGWMAATAPGKATDFVPYGLDPEVDALIGGVVQPDAWLVQTVAGRWWVWEYGAAAPADERAALYETQARQAGGEGRVD